MKMKDYNDIQYDIQDAIEELQQELQQIEDKRRIPQLLHDLSIAKFVEDMLDNWSEYNDDKEPDRDLQLQMLDFISQHSIPELEDYRIFYNEEEDFTIVAKIHKSRHFDDTYLDKTDGYKGKINIVKILLHVDCIDYDFRR